MLPEPTVEQVRASVAEGLSDSQLGRRFGRGDGWAYKFRRRHRIASSNPRPSRKTREELDAENAGYAAQPQSPETTDILFDFHAAHGPYTDMARLERKVTVPTLHRPIDVTAAVCGDPKRRAA